MSFAEQLEPYSEELLTKQLLLSVLKDYKRPFDKIHELVKLEMLSPVKSGLFVPGKKAKIEGPSALLVANHLWGPSYISLDTALAYWGLIPERSFEISSVTTKRAKIYSTINGQFSYVHANVPYYSMGLKNVSLSKKQSIIMASPEKALCDKLIFTSGIILRSAKQALELLTEDLRMDENSLKQMDVKMITSWIPNSQKQKTLELLVNTLEAL